MKDIKDMTPKEKLLYNQCVELDIVDIYSVCSQILKLDDPLSALYNWVHNGHLTCKQFKAMLIIFQSTNIDPKLSHHIC